MSLNEQFYHRTLIEQRALNLLKDYFGSKYDYKLHFQNDNKFSKYDAVLMLFEKGTGSVNRQYLIEVKVRDRSYPELILEKKKYDNLVKEKRKIDKRLKVFNIKTKILYFCVCPDGSYLFNLEDMKFEWITQPHWVSTVDKSRGKIDKQLTMLNIFHGKKFPITTEQCQLPPHDDIKEQIIEQKQTTCLYEILSMNNGNDEEI